MDKPLNFVMIPVEQLDLIVTSQKDILNMVIDIHLRTLEAPLTKHITIKEFMKEVKIGRTKCDELLRTNKIKFIKKRRKIYIPTSEIFRYFNDHSIQ